MKSFESDIQKIVQKMRLKASERDAIRERIFSYMEYHPLTKQPITSLTHAASPREDFFYISFTSLPMRIVSGLLLVVLVVGVPLLAERAVPGDILYMVKTGVNEGIQTQLATSPYEKVELETKLIERRIAEARLLAQEGKLTAQVEAEIAETVRGHASAVQNGIAELRTQDADGAAIAEIVFNSALEVQSAVLGESEVQSSSSVVAILDAVNTVRNDVAVAANENSSTPSFESLSARIEQETTRSYELFKAVQKNATADETRDIERRLGDVDRSILEARELHNADPAQGINEMMEVLGLIQKLIAFMTDIDIRETVALETLVPVIRTDEERIATINELLGSLQVDRATVLSYSASSSDDGLVAKMRVGIGQIDLHVASATELLSIGDIAGAETLVGTARALMDDVRALTIPNDAPVPLPLPQLDTTTPENILEQNTNTTTEDGSTGTTTTAQ